MESPETSVTELQTIEKNHPFQLQLDALSPHFIGLALGSEDDMAFVLSLACPQNWICYGSAEVKTLPAEMLSSGAILRFIGVNASVPVDVLFAHATELIGKNRQIEETRERIAREQQAAQLALQDEITTLMGDTGGFIVQSQLLPASQPRFTDYYSETGDSGFTIQPREPQSRQPYYDDNGQERAPTLEELARRVN